MSKFFTSDNPDYEVFPNNNGEAEISVIPHEHDDLSFTKWSSATSLPSTAGNYCLSADVTISSRWDVPAGTTNLCLNGHSITRTNASGATGMVINVGSGAVLNLYDCDDETTHYYTVDDPSPNGAGLGRVVDESTYQAAGVNARGTFKGGYITGGSITGENNGTSHLVGGGVNVDSGSFTLNGGTIIGNSVTWNGGGVKVRGKNASFTMNGGAILANWNRYYGGGISVGDNNAGNVCKLKINGGTIRHNWSGRNGGAIHLDGKAHTVLINGGNIIDNYTDGNLESTGRSGGGILTDVTSVQLSGTPVIKGNAIKLGVSNDISVRANGSDRLDLSGHLEQGADVGIYVPGWTSNANVDYMVATGAEQSDIRYVHYDVPSEGLLLFCDGSKDWICLDGALVELSGGHHTHQAGTVWVSSLPVAAVTAGETTTLYGSLDAAVSAWTTGSTLKLLADVTTSSTITVPAGEHTLDLNGHGIRMTGSGGVIQIPSDVDLTLIDSRAEGNTHYYYIDSATNLAVLASTQEAAQSGNSDKNGSFTGGYLIGGNNPSYDDQGGGGILVLGKLTMNNGTVIGNYVAGAGGGINVCSGGNASITGANIIGNKTGNVGGGVDIPNYANTVATLEQCVIRHNHANSNTGGIAARGGRVTLKDCDVLDNTAQNNTSGLLAQNCHLTVENVSVKGNATANSSNAYTPGLTLRNSNYNNFSFTMKGAVTVENNTMAGKADDSIYIHNGRNIAVGGEMTNTVPIKIRMQSGQGEFTSGWKANMGTADPSKYFTSDDNNYQVFLNGNGEAEIGTPPVASVINGDTTMNYGTLSEAVYAWAEGSTLKLLADVTTNSTITVPSGEHTLDLNGHTLLELSTVGKFLVGAGASSKADLTIIDSVGTGVIRHETSRPGSLIWVKEGSSLTLDGGTLEANSSASPVIDFFQQKNSSFTMNGGKITGTANNGAVRFSTNCAFTMTGGEISGLQTSAGLFDYSFDSGSAINISGNPVVTSNTANGSVCNFNLPDSKVLTVIGKLTDGASIGITTQSSPAVFTSGWKEKMGDDEPSGYFKSDNSEMEIRTENDEAIVAYPILPDVSAEGHECDYDGSAYGITVTAPEGAEVKYGTEEGSYTLDSTPTYTNAGSYNVYYQVSKEKYSPVTGYAVVNIKPINTTVTITGHSTTADYDGKAHTVSGYDAVSDSELYDVTKDFTFTGTAEAERTNAGTTKMGLDAKQFENKNSNFATVTFNVTDGYVTINPIDVTVTITGHNTTADYDGKAHTVSGYDAVSDSELYDVTKDFAFTGTAEAERTNAGTTRMGLDAKQFENKNGNFATVTFNVTDGYIVVNTVYAEITSAPKAKDKLVYNGTEQELITAGSVVGGTFFYAIGSDPDESPDDGRYKTELPKASEVGNYYIWYKVKSDANHNDLPPVCMKVTMAESVWVTINGVIYTSDNAPAAGASVSLTQGSKTIDVITSGNDGGYYFTVPAGIYNIVVSFGDATVTNLVDITESKTYDLVMPETDTDSLLDVVDSEKSIVVGGLDAEANSVRAKEGVSGEKNVTVKMTVKAVAGGADTGSTEIQKAYSDKNFEYYDLKAEKTVDTVTSEIKETDNVLEIIIPCSFTDKKELSVYNSDGTNVQALAESDSREEGTFRVDRSAGLVYVYARHLMTYAVGYKPYYNVKSEMKLGCFKGNVSVKLTKADCSSIFDKHDVWYKNVIFSGIPKGNYIMVITWTDGAQNTLTLPFTIK